MREPRAASRAGSRSTNGPNRSAPSELLLFGLSTATYQLSRLLVSLYVAHRVGPASFGVWNSLHLVVIYGFALGIGLPNGMNRDVPLLEGEGRSAEARRVVNRSLAFVLVSFAVGGVTIYLASLHPGWSASYRDSLAALAALFLAWNLYLFFQMLLRCRMQFQTMSVQGFLFAALLPLAVVPLAVRWSVPGFILGQAVACLATSLFILRRSPVKPDYRWALRDVAPQVRVGLPIMAAGVVYSLLTTIDRWVVLSFLGTEALGDYTLAILSVSLVALLPAIVSQYTYPRMAFRYGQTHDVTALRPLVLRQTAFSIAVTLPLIGAAYLALPLLTRSILTEYEAGVAPARILLIGLAFIPLTGGLANLLITVGKQMSYLAAQCATVVANLVFSVSLVLLVGGLTGVALGAALSYLLYAILILVLGLRAIRR